jgi:uncharacterized protein YggE
MMKRMREMIVILAVAALPMFGSEPVCDVHSITVTGNGTAKIAPDRVSFSVGVNTTTPTVTEAFNTNNEKTARVVAALKARGVLDAEIQTSNFSISTDYDNYSGRRKVIGYIVTNMVTVTRENPKGAADLIAVAVNAGANEANGVTFFNADPAASRDRAIERAVRDARAQADKLAGVTGVTLGRVLTITTAEVPTSPSMNNNSYRSQYITVTAESPAIEAGTNIISYSVTITYELK